MRVPLPRYWTLRTRLGTHPLLFEAVFRFLNQHIHLTDPRTDIVFEGYPRSGNSYSVFAFTRAQEQGLKIANHVHSPSQLIQAARLDLPCCLLIRSPADAAFAFKLKVPHLASADLLQAYWLFYKSLLTYREHFVIGVFTEVTSDFGRVIRKINKRFGTTFKDVDRARHASLSRAFFEHQRYLRTQGRLWYVRPGDRDRSVRKEQITRHRAKLRRCEEIYKHYADLAESDEV